VMLFFGTLRLTVRVRVLFPLWYDKFFMSLWLTGFDGKTETCDPSSPYLGRGSLGSSFLGLSGVFTTMLPR